MHRQVHFEQPFSSFHVFMMFSQKNLTFSILFPTKIRLMQLQFTFCKCLLTLVPTHVRSDGINK